MWSNWKIHISTYEYSIPKSCFRGTSITKCPRNNDICFWLLTPSWWSAVQRACSSRRERCFIAFDQTANDVTFLLNWLFDEQRHPLFTPSWWSAVRRASERVKADERENLLHFCSNVQTSTNCNWHAVFNLKAVYWQLWCSHCCDANFPKQQLDQHDHSQEPDEEDEDKSGSNRTEE